MYIENHVTKHILKAFYKQIAVAEKGELKYTTEIL